MTMHQVNGTWSDACETCLCSISTTSALSRLAFSKMIGRWGLLRGPSAPRCTRTLPCLVCSATVKAAAARVCACGHTPGSIKACMEGNHPDGTQAIASYSILLSSCIAVLASLGVAEAPLHSRGTRIKQCIHCGWHSLHRMYVHPVVA